MPMIWDAPLVGAIATELDDRLGGGRLRAHVFDWSGRELVLFFRSHTLRWSLHPGAGWLRMDPAEDPPPHARPLSAELEAVEAAADERILRFRLRKVRGRSRSIQVVVELMTNQWNALLVEGEDRWIRHLLWTRRPQGRILQVGYQYTPPPPSARRGKDEPLTEEEWRRLVAGDGAAEADPAGGGQTGGGPGTLEASLLGTVAFTSPINVPALLCEPPEVSYPLWLQLRSPDPIQSCLLEIGGDQQPYPILLEHFRCVRFPSLLGAFQACAEAEEGEDHHRGVVLERIRKALKRAEGRVRGLQREMDQAGDPNELRERANLLLARLGEVTRGSREVTLMGFHGETVTIDLDPSRSPHENAEALYQEAGRQERALTRLPPLLAKAQTRVEELTRIRERLLSGGLTSQEAESRLPSDATPKPGRPKEEPIRLPYRRFRSSGGLEIRVGRGSSDNDDLTFRHSNPDDVWLHARDSSGAHVVLRWQRDDPPPTRDLTEAAVLAALHSAARHASVAPVDWTRRKHVRKPRKARPGTVTLQKASTLFVEVDPDLPKRLAWGEPEDARE